MKTLRDKVAVVTGAGSGIGRAIALELAKQGTGVAACDLDADTAAETAKLIGDAATAHQVDVSAEDDMRRLVDDVLERHGQVDIVVNNAGIGLVPTNSWDVPLRTYRRHLEVNYLGAVHGSLFFLPELRTRPAANLVNVCSWTGLLAASGSAPYAASKFAVRGFTEALRMELCASPVRVTLVYPGLTRTSILDHTPDIDMEKAAALKKVQEWRFVPGPEVVAARVVDGIRRDRPRVLVGVDTQVVDRIARFLPGGYSRLLHRPVARANSMLAS